MRQHVRNVSCLTCSHAKCLSTLVYFFPSSLYVPLIFSTVCLFLLTQVILPTVTLILIHLMTLQSDWVGTYSSFSVISFLFLFPSFSWVVPFSPILYVFPPLLILDYSDPHHSNTALASVQTRIYISKGNISSKKIGFLCRARKIASPTSRGYCVFQSGYQNISLPCPTGYLPAGS